jgi:hypothetical protein
MQRKSQTSDVNGTTTKTIQVIERPKERPRTVSLRVIERPKERPRTVSLRIRPAAEIKPNK